MKYSRRLAATLATLMVATIAMAAETEAPKQEPTVPVEMKMQTLCPVMGGKIDSTVYTDIQGQRVYHCCPMCSSTLVEDPDTFFKKAAADGVMFENIQTTCPISGEALEDKSVYVDYEGRRIAFCCEKCVATFNKDPQKVLSKMDVPKDTEKDESKPDSSGHEGHNH